MRSFQERNQAVVGAVSIAVLSLIGLTAFYSDDLPIIGGGRTYTAQFTEAAGLISGTEVRAAGVKIGTVKEVDLEGDHIKVRFRVKDAWIGDKSTVAIRIKTLLGSKYLSVDPQGDAEQDPGQPIPIGRTASPYDINQVFDQLATTVTEIDTNKLAESLGVLADTFQDSPKEIRSALEGLSALSKTISTRDQELAKLFANTHEISKVFADRDAQVEKLLKDGELLLGEIRKRRDSISSLLAGTRELAAQLSGLVADNTATLRPALQQLDRVNSILQRNQDNLNRSLQMAGPYYRLLGNAGGNGRWLDMYVCGLVAPVGSPPDTDPANGNCIPPKGSK
ncbi:MCE family protein [Kibdelosporangium phytohabitans]|uniref:ABC transporter substrate-binding protein n=1 Tax=Kibdelosporangium phytohabitans TaxID=860235 RepID=A0A0N9I832_9PSEU|nr:MCE family protein [Kibdelosporangium phytohabitans]ALG11082.1 ABC transporter substrate-binding protein [Kibdelosporangium phytohabitans]MBE1462324.1 phospholipid/cholesterol/gamma-HCH transport system substrate-binding protein [Kibdelosporangium phytohabitans]